MERPQMNEARMRACMKKGRSRSQCMKEVYPDGPPSKGSSKKKSSSKKPNPFKKGGTY